MCSAGFSPNESFKNICKVRTKLHCRGFMKLQNKAAWFKTMQRLPEDGATQALALSTPSS